MAKKGPQFNLWIMLGIGIVVGILATVIIYNAKAALLSAKDPNKCPVYKPNNPHCSIVAE